MYKNKKSKSQKLVIIADISDINKALAGYYIQLNTSIFENFGEI